MIHYFTQSYVFSIILIQVEIYIHYPYLKEVIYKCLKETFLFIYLKETNICFIYLIYFNLRVIDQSL